MLLFIFSDFSLSLFQCTCQYLENKDFQFQNKGFQNKDFQLCIKLFINEDISLKAVYFSYFI